MRRGALDVPQGFTLKTEICVIGSGAGGGVAAGVLAEAGHSLVLLEEGQAVPTARLNQRERQMYPLLYRDGGDQMSADGGVSVLQGSVVGGSTVVNMADVVEIPDPVLGHWAQRYGVDRFQSAQWRQAAARARAAIGANRIPPAELNRNAQLLLEGGRALGISGGTFEHNRVGCVGSGYCLLGCSYDAKKSTALTWIPRALATGNCMLQSGAKVTRLHWRGRRVYAAEGHLITPGSRAPLGNFRVEAERFVLACGAIHSPLVLLASKLGGPMVGEHLSLQPQAPITARFADSVRMFRGIPQGAYLDGHETCTVEQGLGGFRVEAVSATPGMAAASSVGWGAELMEQMRAYDRMAAALCLVPDRPSGRVTRSGLRPRIEYAYSEEWQQRMRQALSTAARVYFAAGAEQVSLPIVGMPPLKGPGELQGLQGLPLEPGRIQLISAHPQGTCRVGPDPQTSVVDLGFGVHGVDNLQVLDASVFPSSASSHTMLPVMQVALLGSEPSST